MQSNLENQKISKKNYGDILVIILISLKESFGSQTL
jgi:hypothetical protein